MQTPLLLVRALCGLAAVVVGQALTPAALYSTVFYDSGALKIEAYVYKPDGAGPFPLVIYNHGSRAGQERTEQAWPFIGRLLTGAGYAVIVPERRGYGKSGGETFSDEIGTDKGARFIARQQAEADDVIAAAAYARTLPFVDAKHIGVMGWSFGGITTVFAASRTDAFVAAVNQAGGSLSWNGSPALQRALPDAARKIRIPLLCLVAENDATTAAVKGVYEAARPHNTGASLVVYPPFTPAQNPGNVAPGHTIFGSQGLSIWSKDVLSFLAKYLRG